MSVRIAVPTVVIAALIALGCSGMGTSSSSSSSSKGKKPAELKVASSTLDKKQKRTKRPENAIEAEAKKGVFVAKLDGDLSKKFTSKSGKPTTGKKDVDSTFGALNAEGSSKVLKHGAKNSDLNKYLGLD